MDVIAFNNLIEGVTHDWVVNELKKASGVDREEDFDNLAVRQRMLGDAKNTFGQVAHFIMTSDPVSVRTKERKTPFVKDILRWFLAHTSVQLPDDIEIIRETLTLYQKAKNEQGLDIDIKDYNHPADLRAALVKEVGDIDKYSALELELVDGEYKMYRIDTWEQGEIAFANSGWCVRHTQEFHDYGPPFWMIVDGSNKRVALIHHKGEMTDVHNRPLTDSLLQALAPFIRHIFDIVKFIENSGVRRATKIWSESEIFSAGIRKESAYILCFYARDVMKRPYNEPPRKEGWEKAEDILKRNANYAVVYARDVLREPFPAAEPFILASGCFNLKRNYATQALKKRWPEFEEIVNKSISRANEPTSQPKKGRPKKKKDTFTHFPNLIPYVERFHTDFANAGGWPELEKEMLKLRPSQIFGPGHIIHKYYSLVKKGDWPEYEQKIYKGREDISGEALSQAFLASKKPWPELKDYLMGNTRDDGTEVFYNGAKYTHFMRALDDKERKEQKESVAPDSMPLSTGHLGLGQDMGRSSGGGYTSKGSAADAGSVVNGTLDDDDIEAIFGDIGGDEEDLEIIMPM